MLNIVVGGDFPGTDHYFYQPSISQSWPCDLVPVKYCGMERTLDSVRLRVYIDGH
jgi:hypothetical protein